MVMRVRPPGFAGPGLVSESSPLSPGLASSTRPRVPISETTPQGSLTEPGRSSPGGHRFDRIPLLPPASSPRLRDPREPASEKQAEELGPILGERLGAAGDVGAGRLSPAVRAVAEPILGVPLAGTSLREAPQVAGGEALAATQGSTVTFASGRLGTSTAAGRALLGHELTHVAQQRSSGHAVPQFQQAPAQGGARPRRGLLNGALQRLAAVGDPEILALANLLNLARTGPQVVRTEKVKNVDHSFQVNLTWSRDTSGGRVQEANANAANVHVYDMNIGWVPSQAALPSRRPNSRGQVYPYFLEPNNAGRLSFNIAELLHHELTHVQLLIDQKLEALDPGGAGRSAVFRRFKNQLAKSRSSLNLPLGGDRERVHQAVRGLGLAASRFGVKMNHSRFRSDAAKVIDTLVNERFTFRDTGRAFGFIREDSDFLPIYANRMAGELLTAFLQDSIDRGHTKVDKAADQRQSVVASRYWSAAVSGLVAAVSKLFQTVDKPFEGLLPPLGSGFSPVRPGPLPIGGS